MQMGQASGVAAAYCAETGVTPVNADVGRIQGLLINQDVYLGDPDRLRELGLAH
jgi:hypothetical protein